MSQQQSRINAALDAALDELDSDSDEDLDAGAVDRNLLPSGSGLGPPPPSPEAMLESMMRHMMEGGNEDEFMGQVLGEMEAHIRAEVAQQQEMLNQIPPIRSNSGASRLESLAPPNTELHDSSSKRKHSCPSPVQEDLEDVIGTMFADIKSRQSNLEQQAAMEGADFVPPDFPEDDELLQNLMKGLESLDTNDLDADSVIDSMMEQLLSKDLMYQPMKQVAQRFPSWLEENKSRLTMNEYSEREKQCECFQRLVNLYETNPSRTSEIMDIMQEVQEYGQPPADIIREIAPGIELDEDGSPKMEECTIM